MTISGRLALLLTASVVGAGLTATTTTAASAATTSRADAVGLTTSVAAATNGSAIDYIFVSYTVRARTWETVIPAASTNGIATSPPSDHSMIMTWAHV